MAVSDGRIYHHVQHIRRYVLRALLIDLLPCRLSPADELSGVHSGERQHAVHARLIHSKIAHPRCTLTPEQGLCAGHLADTSASILFSQWIRLLIIYDLDLLDGFVGLVRSIKISHHAPRFVAHLLCPAGASIGTGQD